MQRVISVVEEPHGINPFIAAMIHRSGRSWWQARYSDGMVLSEWETLQQKILLPIAGGKSSRWEDVTKDKMVGLRLLCPNRMVGELEAPEGHLFFQLKVGGVDIVMSGSRTRTNRFCDAHIIGVITDLNGNCFCRAWETKTRELIQFYDNVTDMKYRNIGKLNLDVQGVKT